MHGKYCSHKHPVDVTSTAGSSKIWKYMVKSREVAEANMHWLLGTGDIHVSNNKWVTNIPITDVDISIKELFFPDGKPNKEKISELCGVRRGLARN